MGEKYVSCKMKAKCKFGKKSMPLLLPIDHGVMSQTTGQALMNANDHIPVLNILSYGLCTVTGFICVPVTPFAWMMGNSNYILDGAPILTKKSKLMCIFGGVISIEG